MYLTGTRIPLTDREGLWVNSVKQNKTVPEASRTYLSARKNISPEQKYDFPKTSSFEYGWKLNEQVKSYSVNIIYFKIKIISCSRLQSLVEVKR